MSIDVGENDAVVREAAVKNIRNIAGKVDALRAEVSQQMQDAKLRVFDDTDFTDNDALEVCLKLMSDHEQKVRRLLHGLAIMMEMGRGGSVTAEDETSLLACGVMVVGLVDHGDHWSTHS